MSVESARRIFEKVIWSVEKPEKQNVIETHYINFLIKLGKSNVKRGLKKVLDIPCGIGRHHKYLREFGCEVYGADVNPIL